MNEIISYLQSVYRSNLRYIAELSVPFIVVACLSYFMPPQSGQTSIGITIIWLFLYFIGLSIYQCALVLFLSQEYQNDIAPIKINLLNSLAYTPYLFTTYLVVYSPFILAVAILLSSAFLAVITTPLIVIGIYASLKSTFVPFHIVLEEERPIQAIIHSFSQTKGYLGKILLILLGFYLFSSIVDILTSVETTIKPVNFVLFAIGVASTILLVSAEQTAVFKLYVDSCNEAKKD